MEIKKYWSILLLVAVSLPLFNSCGGDPDSNDDGNTGQIPDEQKVFLGYWHSTDGSNSDFIFNADGTCNAYDFYDTTPKSGIWSYDNTTKTLSTTIGSNSWIISISNYQAWAGVHLGGGGAESFARSDLQHLWRVYLKCFNWIKDDTYHTMSFSSNAEYYFDDTSIRIYGSNSRGSDMKFVVDLDWQWDFSFNDPEYVVESFDGDMTSASMKINNCKLQDGIFVASISQNCDFNMILAYHNEWIENGKEYTSKTYYDNWKSSSEKSFLLKLSDTDKSNPILTITYDDWKAVYKGFR